MLKESTFNSFQDCIVQQAVMAAEQTAEILMATGLADRARAIYVLEGADNNLQAAVDLLLAVQQRPRQ
jgi:hypothetical protein